MTVSELIEHLQECSKSDDVLIRIGDGLVEITDIYTLIHPNDRSDVVIECNEDFEID